MQGDAPPADVKPRPARYLWIVGPPLIAWAAQSAARGEWTQGARASVVVVDAWVPTTLYLLALASFLVPMILWFPRRSLAPHPFWMLAVGAATLFQTCGATLGVGPWREVDRAIGPDGRAFVRLLLPVGHDSLDALAVVRRDGAFSRTYELLAEPTGDGPSTCFIRPVDAGGRELFFSDDGLVVAGSGGRCRLAAATDGSRPISADASFSLSPFLVLNAGTPGDERDLDEVCDVAARRAEMLRNHEPQYTTDEPPSEESIVLAFDHANPWIRAAARRIVEAGGAETYPAATRRLASSPK